MVLDGSADVDELVGCGRVDESLAPALKLESTWLGGRVVAQVKLNVDIVASKDVEHGFCELQSSK